jgi:hypothetical protein
MKRIFVGLAIMLVFGLAASARSDQKQTDAWQEQTPITKPLKLKAAGEIDLNTGAIMFGGTATHFGLYTATGFFNPADFSIFGTIEVASGDSLSFTAAFVTGPLGEIDATFNIMAGTGRFAGVTGTASGPVTLDPDFTFLITVLGEISY